MTAAHGSFTVSLSTSCGPTVYLERQLAQTHTHTHIIYAHEAPVTNRHNESCGTQGGDQGTCGEHCHTVFSKKEKIAESLDILNRLLGILSCFW